MLKKLITAFGLLLCLFANAQTVFTSDIDNFWAAYDKIVATRNKATQYKLINTLYINKGTPGLKAIMQARNYTDTAYIEAINNYPRFWKSIRANTLKAKQFAGAISNDIAKIKSLYPDLKPAPIYFTIGALRTGGTTLDNMVLIGSEIALADSSTDISELPPDFSNLEAYFKTNPINDVVFLNVHEYTHTQQKTTVGPTLLAQCIIEGVAEFVAVTATEKPSLIPALSYGQANALRVRAVFESQMFNPYEGFWLYSNADNEFHTRDMGYYVGYAICESYYTKATDKKAAIKTMIELDYDNEAALLKFAEESGYFSSSLNNLKDKYEKSRPTVVNYTLENKAVMNKSGIQKCILTITFSEKIDPNYRNFEYGPMGKEYVLNLIKFKGYSDDGKSAYFEVHTEAGKHYQLLVGSGFRNEKGIALKPYLIDIERAP